MTRKEGYASPAAFRRALTERLRARAMTGASSLPELQRQFAYDRLLERLYRVNPDWILKGAAALLAREIGVRATIDIDVYRAVDSEVAERDLRTAAGLDLGDWFTFEIGPARPLRAGATSTRFHVTARVGTTAWAAHQIDLAGLDVRMTAHPDHVGPLVEVTMPNVDQGGYTAYPLVDHIADKLAAILERHGEKAAPSTRFKDLVDLVAIVTRAEVPADLLARAIGSEAEHRGLELTATFEVPDRQLWESGYAAEANRSRINIGLTLDDALAIVRPLVEPLLRGEAEGRWDPRHQRWL
ncbi:MAG: nucleotidyl transferase AbiEii/AbiGii toxin family protein [Candidatus Dormibacteraeota bacterium]|nr:nucleotidyl transferase AbiEii/AbiGii toxin family protein [Candidatus Dormibacteraeota bacterium]